MDSRYVTDFAKLCELLVCDRNKSTLSDSCLQYVLSIESGTREGWMPLEELTSSIDRYQSAHSVAGVPRAFAIGAPARPVRPQTFGVRRSRLARVRSRMGHPLKHHLHLR